MDEKDRKIIDILTEDSSLSSRQISRKTGLPVTTVHNRLKKLREDGIIKRYTIELDHKKLGKTFAALVHVSCNYDVLRSEKSDQHKLAREISRLPGVEKVDIVTGSTDMIVRVRTSDVEEYDTFLFKRLQAIPGIEDTQTFVIINEG
jgi:DNA-binding Lrp family transcriptional regulator